MGKRLHNVDSSLRQVDSEPHHNRHLFPSGMWQKIHHFFAKDDPTQSPIECPEDEQWPPSWDQSDPSKADQPPSRPVGVGLPRQATFRRQNSERRERLLPVEPDHAERRAVSSTRHVSTSLPRPRATSSPPYWVPARVSAPAVGNTARFEAGASDTRVDTVPTSLDPMLQALPSHDMWQQDEFRPPRPPSTTSSDDSHFGGLDPVDDKADLRAELDSRWILNLSMHFRDKSDREKFFVTYAETPNRWRRVTISCDYRNAEPGSLEMDLKELSFQRDKSLQIYESIRDSLPEIQFYDTVTNLKLETTDGRLHVHVTEDVNEIIQYPQRNTVAHILNDPEFQPLEIPECELVFDSHLSGFVYKVQHNGKVYIKKEIPGPDTVDEFLYEINALHALHGSSHVIALEAIVLDDTNQIVKGLLISYAERGAIVDLLYDHKGSTPWEDRCRWAEHAVRGLSEIHEEGYVQGDFTLSNIVVDEDKNAKIIDINRRGCPVGWEPPEIAAKIASNQRISMYIGEKSDLYQLGMTLWALAMDDDEPERHVPPLSVDEFPAEVPEWYQTIVRICLSARPRDRLSAKELIDFFPEGSSSSSDATRSSQKRPPLKLMPPKEYIDPANAVERDDIERFSHSQQDLEPIPYSPESSRDDYTFTYPKSSNFELESESSAYDRPRGRRPPSNYGHLGRNERHHWIADDTQSVTVDEPEPNIVAISPGNDREYFDEVELNGHPYLISRGTFNREEMQILEQEGNLEPQSQDQASMFDGESVDIAGPLDSAALQSPRRPPLVTRNSTTSDITPRGSHAVLPIYNQSPPEDLLSESSSTADLNGLGSHTEPNLTEATQLSIREEDASHRRSGQGGGQSLFCEDSGYDEPLHNSEYPEHDDLQPGGEIPFETDGESGGEFEVAEPSQFDAHIQGDASNTDLVNNLDFVQQASALDSGTDNNPPPKQERESELPQATIAGEPPPLLDGLLKAQLLAHEPLTLESKDVPSQRELASEAFSPGETVVDSSMGSSIAVEAGYVEPQIEPGISRNPNVDEDAVNSLIKESKPLASLSEIDEQNVEPTPVESQRSDALAISTTKVDGISEHLRPTTSPLAGTAMDIPETAKPDFPAQPSTAEPPHTKDDASKPTNELDAANLPLKTERFIPHAEYPIPEGVKTNEADHATVSLPEDKVSEKLSFICRDS